MGDLRRPAEDPRLPWLRLASLSWLGATIKTGLIKTLGSPEAAFSASPETLAQVAGWDNRRFDRFCKERHQAEPLCPLETLDKKGIQLLTFNDPGYPPLLRQTHDGPIALFALGKPIPEDSRPHLAVVGARNASQQGYDIAREFSFELAKAGFVIVSGLALGIDTYAHRGALEANGRTIGILGGGVDIIYPAGNRRIREQIRETGLLLSEYPPGMPARPWHFPQRNRIISGMCVGTLVVEASAQSGSLITARMAAEQDREVFAIPGNLRSNLAQGTLALLKEGANLVTEPATLIEHFSHLLPEKPTQETSVDPTPLTEEERQLVELLRDDPVPMDRLLQDGRWDRSKLFSLLLSLEMRDILVKFSGNLYQAKMKTVVR